MSAVLVGVFHSFSQLISRISSCSEVKAAKEKAAKLAQEVKTKMENEALARKKLEDGTAWVL
jgi:hypothetical protein